jgi:hypothetical protein
MLTTTTTDGGLRLPEYSTYRWRAGLAGVPSYAAAGVSSTERGLAR